MARQNYNELLAFLAVARERSFTRAAAQLGVSPSALSHTIRALETGLGVRLLTRTTRSVAPTAAGDRLIQSIGSRFDDIDSELAALTALRDSPSGSLRITSHEHAATSVLWPVLQRFIPKYPDISIEVVADSRFVDIVAERFDAGIRLGESVAKDMVAVPIGPATLRMLVVGAPAYFNAHPPPRTPHDLTRHDCINIRFLTLGGLYVWEFERDGRELTVRVEGRLTFTSITHMRNAALAGFGLAFLFEDLVKDDIAAGRLRVVLDDWTPPFGGYHLYYPSRRHHSAAFSLLLDALRV
jgi:DNA-binding transcriptional LysR family regulator